MDLNLGFELSPESRVENLKSRIQNPGLVWPDKRMQRLWRANLTGLEWAKEEDTTKEERQNQARFMALLKPKLQPTADDLKRSSGIA